MTDDERGGAGDRYGAHMPRRFVYSRWDGTQRGFELDADDLMAQLTDDVIHHGDVDAALRRLMREGLRSPDGRREGLAQMMERIRERRRELEESGDLDGMFADAVRELDDILDEERHAIDRALGEAEASGDERRADTARTAATERLSHLDLLPRDLAGRLDALSAYDFESAEAAARLADLTERLRAEMLQQVVDRVTESMSSVTTGERQRRHFSRCSTRRGLTGSS